MAENEAVFDLATARTLRAVDATRWLGTGNAFWLEWDHPGETPRPFAGIVEGLEWVRWGQLIKPGSTCIDIGTHSGDTTIPMGLFCYDKRNDRKGCVIGVEPNPDIHPLVEACMALNRHVADFRLEKCAVTAVDMDSVELADHGNANCNGGIIGDYSDALTDQLRKSAGVTYTTQGKTLKTLVDAYARTADVSNVQFVKMDCEGYDKEIIRSSKEILNTLKPFVFAEWFGWFSPSDDDDFFAAIEEVGYVALHPGTLRPVDRAERLSDVTCVHKDRMNELSVG